ncbi:MAG: laccase domain-containing protein [Candidatus Paceibacterota bacterium]
MLIRSALLGRSQGDFKPAHFASPQEFAQALRAKSPTRSDLYSIRCAFVRDTLWPSQEEAFSSIDSNVWRSCQQADAVSVGRGQAAVISNADCPILALASQTQLVVAHCGLGSLVDLTGQGRPSLIDCIAQRFGKHFTEAFIGYGIGPCCYTAPHAMSLLEKEGSQAAGPKATVNLIKLIREQMLRSGIRVNYTNIEARCTACAKVEGEYTYHSHRRGDQSRNAAVFWLG